ncbi:hypothetical protein [Chromobacterium aquaticum]|uniref:Uncharacterized protein n=1 Tax=Chromobacterium aquaticum TaxID=467180 RepID=A0ABV8ZWV0_9NEIS|nr:hypothetical protein [Chromobacterium aquaticum]MCD5361066.1 hypothetical protein [Chromobacterium aquaticum]
MDIFTKENLSLALGVLGAWSFFKGSYYNIWTWSRNNKVVRLTKEKEFFISLKKSDRDLFIFVSSSAFAIAFMVGVALMFHSAGMDPGGEKIIHFTDWLFGFGIYMLSTFRMGQLNRLRKFDQTVQKIDAQLKKLQG